MSEVEVLERRIRIKRKKKVDTAVQLSSQQQETIQELLCGHRSSFDSAFYRFSGFRVRERLTARMFDVLSSCLFLTYLSEIFGWGWGFSLWTETSIV